MKNSCRRILLLRWHVDEDDEDLACVHAGSGSHDLDAPLPGMPEMPGAMLIPADTYGDRAPFWFGGGAESAQRADRGSTRG